MWELITLNFAQNNQQYARRGKIARQSRERREVVLPKQQNLKIENAERKRQNAKRSKQQSKIAKELLRQTYEAIKSERKPYGASYKQEPTNQFRRIENEKVKAAAYVKTPKATEEERLAENRNIYSERLENHTSSDNQEPLDEKEEQKSTGKEDYSSDWDLSHETADSLSEDDSRSDTSKNPQTVIEHDTPGMHTTSDDTTASDEEARLASEELEKIRHLEETIVKIRREPTSPIDASWQGWPTQPQQWQEEP